MRVAFFATCLADRFFADACADSVRLLRHLGVDVWVPAGPTCCGQPAFNSGHRREASRMAAHVLSLLDGAERVVVPSGSCAGMIRRFVPGLLEGEARGRALALGERTHELAEFVVRVLGVERLGDGLQGQRLAYHHGCHALRELGVRDEPIALLRGAGADVAPWPESEECCGFGGLFAVKMPEVSGAMADAKLDGLPDVDAVVSADGGCLLQLGGRAMHRGAPAVPFRHLAAVLWQAASA